MNVESFLQDPWRKSHPAYSDSAFNIQPAPEYASSEVIVASLYRGLGFSEHSEAKVPASGREFERAMRFPSSSSKAGSAISVETWLTVLHGTLESPQLRNQSSRRSLHLCPLVPDVALYSGSARLTGNSWNPGLLIQHMLRLGSIVPGAAELVWGRLFEALTVTENDDIWARWLQEEFSKRRQPGIDWIFRPIVEAPDMPFPEKAAIEFPARQFVRDLDAIIDAKGQMTRRQWISLLEAILRLGCVTHVLWLCDVSDRIWDLVRAILDGAEVPSTAELSDRLFSPKSAYLVHGNPTLRIIRDYASGYLVSRLGINLLLWRLEKLGSRLPPMSSLNSLHYFLSQVETHKKTLSGDDVRRQLDGLHEQYAKTLACKKGIGSNLLEFSQHVLSQRLPANEKLRGYDQGYFMKKSGEHRSATWVVSLGPVALLALTHCCLKEVSGPRSVDRFCAHLLRYGLRVDASDITDSDLGQKLRMLGLVLDSPDAESGMLLVPPFQLLSTEPRA
jgi:hypothetical protein